MSRRFEIVGNCRKLSGKSNSNRLQFQTVSIFKYSDAR